MTEDEFIKNCEKLLDGELYHVKSYRDNSCVSRKNLTQR